MQLLSQVKKITHLRTLRHSSRHFKVWKLYHLLKLLFCLVLSLFIFFLEILPQGSVETAFAIDEEDLEELPLTKITIGGSEFQYSTSNAYNVPFGQYNTLLCYLKEPSLFELPYVVDLEFELTAAQFARARTYTNFGPRSVRSNGSVSGSTASTWMEINLRYNYVDGTVGTEDLYDYNSDANDDGVNDYLRTTYEGCTKEVVTVNYHIKVFYTNRVGQLGYGVHVAFSGFTNDDKWIWAKVKTDSGEMQQLKTIAKNTEDTASGITGILDFLPNMLDSIGDFFTNLIDTIVQKFSDLIDDITDLFSDLTTSLSGFFNNLTSSISGFFSNLIQNLVDLFDEITDSIQGFFSDLTTAIGQFFSDLWDNIVEFFTWLFIPSNEDIQDVIDTFQEFWGDTPLLIPFQFVSRILEIFNIIDFVNGYQWSFTLHRWYLQINGANYRVWNSVNVQPFNSDSGIYYIVCHDFSSGSYPYVAVNAARLGLYWAFWLFATFKTMIKFADKLGILQFISTEDTQEIIGG